MDATKDKQNLTCQSAGTEGVGMPPGCRLLLQTPPSDIGVEVVERVVWEVARIKARCAEEVNLTHRFSIDFGH